MIPLLLIDFRRSEYKFNCYYKVIVSAKLTLLAVILAQEDNIMRCVIFFMEYAGKIDNCSVSFRIFNALFSWLSSIGSLLIYYYIFLRWIIEDSLFMSQIHSDPV